MVNVKEISDYRKNLFLNLALVLVAGIIGGLIALITLTAIIWLSHTSYGVDIQGKHGISQTDPSRLGGIAVLVSAYLYFTGSIILEETEWLPTGVYWKDLFGYEWLAILIGLVGLIEDFKQKLHAMTRLSVTTLICLVALYLFPDYLPETLDFTLFSYQMNTFFFLWIAGSVVLVGFTNAGNIADGANGLLAIILTCLFAIGFSISQQLAYWAICLSLSTFSVYNLLTGKIFLGDFGAYSLSSLAVLCCFDLFDNYSISVWLFGCVLSYPCFEVLRSIINRLKRRSNVFVADETHVHNKVYNKLIQLGLQPLVSNSVTGLTLAFFFAILPLIFYFSGLLESYDDNWFYVFLILGLLYLSLTLFIDTVNEKVSVKES